MSYNLVLNYFYFYNRSYIENYVYFYFYHLDFDYLILLSLYLLFFLVCLLVIFMKNMAFSLFCKYVYFYVRLYLAFWFMITFINLIKYLIVFCLVIHVLLDGLLVSEIVIFLLSWNCLKLYSYPFILYMQFIYYIVIWLYIFTVCDTCVWNYINYILLNKLYDIHLFNMYINRIN